MNNMLEGRKGRGPAGHKIDKSLAVSFAGLVAVILLFELASSGKLLTMRNLQAILNDGFMVIVGAIGVTFVVAQANLDLSIGGIMGVACFMGASAASLAPEFALPVALATGLLLGCVNALLCAKFRINSFITTLAMQFVLKGMLIVLMNDGSLGLPYSMLTWDSSELKLILLIVVAVAGYVVFEHMRMGKEIRAVGSNEEAARQSGVKTKKIKAMGFIITGTLAGFVAFMSIIRTGTASTSSGAGFEFNALMAVLLGGMPITGGMNCRFRSAIIGGLTMAFLTNGMTMCGLDGEMQQLIKGIVFLAAVILTFDRKNLSVIK